MERKYSFEMEEIINSDYCPCRQYSETKGFCYYCGITQEYCGNGLQSDVKVCPLGVFDTK